MHRMVALRNAASAFVKHFVEQSRMLHAPNVRIEPHKFAIDIHFVVRIQFGSRYIVMRDKSLLVLAPTQHLYYDYKNIIKS